MSEKHPCCEGVDVHLTPTTEPAPADQMTDDEQRHTDTPSADNMRSPARSRAVSIARWAGVAISLLSVVFAIMTYLGIWNYLRGDVLLSEVAARFDRSYSEDASRPGRQGDKEWSPLIR